VQSGFVVSSRVRPSLLLAAGYDAIRAFAEQGPAPACWEVRLEIEVPGEQGEGAEFALMINGIRIGTKSS
jgi:hypothetical protein